MAQYDILRLIYMSETVSLVEEIYGLANGEYVAGGEVRFRPDIQICSHGIALFKTNRFHQLQGSTQCWKMSQSSVKTEIGIETSRSKSFAHYVFCTPGAGLGISFVCRIAPAMNFKSAETRAVLRRSSWVSTQRSV